MSKPQRVLVVDDEPDIRTIVGLNLSLSGIEYGEAINGVEAVEMLEGHDFDGCILDLAMPVADGFATLKRLGPTGLLDEIAVVVLSAEGSPTSALHALRLGAHAHLTKPFSPGAVATIMQELLGLTPQERDDRRLRMIERAGTIERLGMSQV